MHLLEEAEFWVAVAFVIFALATARPIGRLMTKALDDRTAQIKQELDEAQQLREEAQAALADYKRKQRDAAKTAEEIMKAAAQEAEIMKQRAEEELARSIKRREEMAVARIAQAEQDAIAEVRNRAVDTAIAATAHLLQQQLAGAKGGVIIDRAIKELPQRFN